MAALLPLRDLTQYILLFNEPNILALQLRIWISKREVEPPYQLGNKHRYFHETYVLADTSPRTMTELIILACLILTGVFHFVGLLEYSTCPFS